MQYRKMGKTGVDVSALGFGMMRLPTTDGAPMSENIDEAKTIEMLRFAIDSGVNYVDTAFFYHKGHSEVVTGKALKDGYREKVNIATKMPVHFMKEDDKFEDILNTQLERLQTDHIDFYLLHSLSSDTWESKILKENFIEKMLRAKQDGKIVNLGFSFHDEYPLFCEIVDHFPWDFCQIQLNYLDTENQAGVKGLQYAADSGLGVIIMEPLLGGKLANPPKGVRDIFSATDPEKGPVEWALDFLWDMPEVSMILSGMTDIDQVKANLEYAERSKVGMMSDEQKKTITAVQEKFSTYTVIPCTGCSYCMPCPQGVEIPRNFKAYNELHTYEDSSVGKGSYSMIPYFCGPKSQAPSCIGCQECEGACPQHIKISEWMPKIANAFK